jgi:hypothetical protein
VDIDGRGAFSQPSSISDAKQLLRHLAQEPAFLALKFAARAHARASRKGRQARQAVLEEQTQKEEEEEEAEGDLEYGSYLDIDLEAVATATALGDDTAASEGIDMENLVDLEAMAAELTADGDDDDADDLDLEAMEAALDDEDAD